MILLGANLRQYNYCVGAYLCIIVLIDERRLREGRVGRRGAFLLVRFKVLTAKSVKIAVLWDVASCRLGGIVGGSKHLWIVGQYPPDNTVQHPTRQLSDISLRYH
jgi:hypothetical protein